MLLWMWEELHSISIFLFVPVDCSVLSDYIHFVSPYLDILFVSISPYLDGSLNQNCLEIALPMSICSLFHGMRRKIFCKISVLTLLCCCLLVVAKTLFHSGKPFLIEYLFFIVPCLDLFLFQWSLDISR